MKIRDSILIILSVGFLSSTVYYVLDANRFKSENKRSQNELLDYIKSTQEVQEKEKANLELLKKEKREKLRLEIKQRVEDAYTLAHRLEEKYKGKRNKKYIILEALNQCGVYVKNYAGDRVGDVKSTYLTNGSRVVALEEIQKVRRRKEGYIKIKSDESNKTEYIYVKDLQMDEFFIGASVIFG